jgi:hypothetical protein
MSHLRALLNGNLTTAAAATGSSAAAGFKGSPKAWHAASDGREKVGQGRHNAIDLDTQVVGAHLQAQRCDQQASLNK